MLTLVIDGRVFPKDSSCWGQLALVCGIAVAESVESFLETGCEPQLKWPNDVYLAGKKCAGILIASGPGSSWLIGIGINVNVPFSEAPVELATHATSMHLHARSIDMRRRDDLQSRSYAHTRHLDSGSVLVELTQCLQRWIASWIDGRADWSIAWQQRCLLSGKSVRVRTTNAVEISGCCEGVDSEGQLLLKDRKHLNRIRSGEILSWH